jgi:hypothetical protein
VDADWRGQIADYVLGQQTGPEATATKGHLKRSEPARMWAYSLLDSLGHLYPNGGMPEIPDAAASAPVAAPATRQAAPAEEPAPAPTQPRPQSTVHSPQTSRPKRSLSPAAQSIVRRRRVIGGALILAALIVGILAIAGVFSGGGGSKTAANTPTTTTGGARTKFLKEGVLRPVNGNTGTGIAVMLQQGNQVQLVVQATRLKPTDRQTAYEVWLYNSPSDVAQLGAQFTDQAGNLQGRGAVPSNWQNFSSVVLSREKVGTNPKTPSALVLRARLSPVPSSQQGSGTGTGTTGG